MAIALKKADRFLGLETRSVWLVHRFATIFGLIVPLLILLFAVLKSGSFVLWPTALARLYERTYLVDWAGIYLLGLIMFVVPALLDFTPDLRTRRVNMGAFFSYALGACFSVCSAVLSSYGIAERLFDTLHLFGTLMMMGGWITVQYRVFSWISAHSKRVDAHIYACAIGMIFFLAAIGLHFLADVNVWIRGLTAVPIHWLFPLRVLPIAAITFMLLALILRLSPEMLGWRPLDDSRVKWLYSFTLISALLIMVGYTWFHQWHELLARLLYGLGAFGILGVSVLLFLSIDFWYMRNRSYTRQEHVFGLYAALTWLLVSSGYFVVVSVWELKNLRMVFEEWSNGLLYAVIAGFFMQAIFGLYTYVANELTDAYPHTDRLTVWALVILNWALLLRVFVVPFTIRAGWYGYAQLDLVLAAMLYVAMILFCADLFVALGGPKLLRKGLLKK